MKNKVGSFSTWLITTVLNHGGSQHESLVSIPSIDRSPLLYDGKKRNKDISHHKWTVVKFLNDWTKLRNLKRAFSDEHLTAKEVNQKHIHCRFVTCTLVSCALFPYIITKQVAVRCRKRRNFIFIVFISNRQKLHFVNEPLCRDLPTTLETN